MDYPVGADDREPPPHAIGALSVGAPLRITRNVDFDQEVVAPVFVDALFGYTLWTRGWQHGVGFGSESFALTRLLDWLYVEARVGVGAVLTNAVSVDPMGRTTNASLGTTAVGSFGLSLGILLGGPWTPHAEPASALPPGEVVEGEGS